MAWAIVLNYEIGEVYCYEYNDNLPDETDMTEWAPEQLGFRPKDCHVMCTNNLAIQIKEKHSEEYMVISKA